MENLRQTVVFICQTILLLAVASCSLPPLSANDGSPSPITAEPPPAATLKTKPAEPAPEPPLSFEDLKQTAECGDVSAMTRLAAAYRIGKLTPKNEAEALKWYLKAAGQKHPDATYLVGLARLQGWGGGRDLPEAVKWFERAAGLGHVGSMGILATIYRRHPQFADPEKAHHWLVKSAEAGLPASMFQLGLAHLAGDGVSKDQQQANHWLERAADAGHPGAVKLLNRPPVATPADTEERE